MDTNGKIVFLAKLADIPLKPYRYRKQQNPYLNAEEVLQVMPEETPILDPHIVNLPPHALNWEHQRQRALKRDNWCCTECATTTYLDVHHIKARQHGGTDRLDNLRTLCRDCHARTPTYGSSTLREERT